MDKFGPELCKVISLTNKVGKSSFDAAAKRLTDITYLFEDVQVFSNSFLNCLNNQTMNQTAYASAQNIAILIYQLQTRIETGFQDKLAGAAEELGTVFGQPVQDAIVEIADNFVSEFTKIDEYLNVILEDVQAVAEAQSDVTATDISVDAMTGLVTTCKDIYVTCQQVDTLITNLVIVSKTLDAVVTQTQTAKQNTTSTIEKASYQLDVSVHSAIKLFSQNMVIFQSSILEAFTAFQDLAAKIFGDDIEVLTDRGRIDTMLSNLFNLVDQNIATRFTLVFSSYYLETANALINLRTQIDANTQQIVDYFTGLAASSGGAVAVCLGPSRNAGATAMKIIQAMGTDSATCLAAQQNYTLAAQSLMNFIAQDVILNYQGAADTLCGCAVGGGKKDKDISKKCINDVSLQDELLFFFSNHFFRQIVNVIAPNYLSEFNYLRTEFMAIQANNDKSQETFLECAASVTTTFDESFAKLQETVNACVATGRSGFLR